MGRQPAARQPASQSSRRGVLTRAAQQQKERDVCRRLCDGARAARDVDVAPGALLDIDGVVAHSERAHVDAFGAPVSGTASSGGRTFVVLIRTFVVLIAFRGLRHARGLIW